MSVLEESQRKKGYGGLERLKGEGTSWGDNGLYPRVGTRVEGASRGQALD